MGFECRRATVLLLLLMQRCAGGFTAWIEALVKGGGIAIGGTIAVNIFMLASARGDRCSE